MSNIERIFVDDIIAHPDDDTPRLVYADWLEIETGQAERAEFIRVQCESERLRDKFDPPMLAFDMNEQDRLDHCRMIDLESVERELFARFLGGTGKVPAHPQFHGRDPVHGGTLHAPEVLGVFRRGFVAEVYAPLRDWLKHGPALCRDHPIEAVTLTDIRPREVNPGKWRFQFYPDTYFGQGGPALPASALPECFRPHMRRNAGTCYGDSPHTVPLSPACCYDYRTEADALADANVGALAWAQDQNHSRSGAKAM